VAERKKAAEKLGTTRLAKVEGSWKTPARLSGKGLGETPAVEEPVRQNEED